MANIAQNRAQVPQSVGTQSVRPHVNGPATDSELTDIARQVAQDSTVSVSRGTPGCGSYANVVSRQIVLDPLHLKNPLEARFTAAHEGAHISDTAPLPQWTPFSDGATSAAEAIGFLALRNVIEDGAVNDRLVRDFPSLGQATAVSYPRIIRGKRLGWIVHPEVNQWRSRTGFVPLYARGLCGLLEDWSELRHKHGFGPLASASSNVPYSGSRPSNSKVAAFLRAATPDARASIARLYPAGAAADVRSRYSLERYFDCRTAIYPKLKCLVDHDLKRCRELLSKKEPKHLRPRNAEELDKKAKELLLEFDVSLRKALAILLEPNVPAGTRPIVAQPRPNPAPGAKAVPAEIPTIVALNATSLTAIGARLRELARTEATPYEVLKQKVSDSVETAESLLRETFHPSAHFRYRGGLASGPIIDMNRAMQFQASGHGASELFMRRIQPTLPDLAVTVLVDRSGSMGFGRKSAVDLEGSRMAPALEAAVFCAELFERLHLDVSIIGFDDEASELKGFRDTVEDPVVRNRICSELTPRGSTDEALAVAKSLTVFAESLRIDKLLVIISDAGADDAEKLKQQLSLAASEGIAVLHFGIGPNTADTKGVYSRSFGNLLPHGEGDDSFLTVFCREVSVVALEQFSRRRKL